MEYTEGLWQGMFGGMSGAWYRTDRICFRTVAEGAEDCTLLLFVKGNDEPERRIPMMRIGNSSVFYTELSAKEARGCETYLFEREGAVFVDGYARSIRGRERFGKLDGEVRPRLPRPVEATKTAFVCPAFSDLIFYKLHVRGFTKHASSGVGVKKRGTFAGLSEKIPYLKELGINAVLLMPVYEFDECMKVSGYVANLSPKQLAQYEERYGSEFVKVQQSYEREGKERKTVERINYWGYTADNFYFAPKASYAADKPHADAELCSLVDALHKAGIAVFFEFFFESSVKHSFVADCLRFWTYVYGADGFRLAGDGSALPLLLEDPYLSGVKFLVTEYYGNAAADAVFSSRRVAAYNDGFRNVMRRFVKGDENMVGEFVARLKSDVPEYANVQYIADQNGFCLYDLFSYDRKHNEANGEENKDGEDYNYSWNCGAEGETQKKKINGLRARLRKNALCTVLLSQSVPLLFAGDEFGHTKKGNNNAYCQDNEISWLNWHWNKERREQLEFVKSLIAFRKEHRVLSGGRTFRESDWKGVGMPDFSCHGVMLWQPDYAPYSRTVSVLLCGEYAATEPEADLYLLFNMHWEELRFALPEEFSIYKQPEAWEVALDTSGACELLSVNAGKQIAVTAGEGLKETYCNVPARTIVVLKRGRAEQIFSLGKELF